MVEAVEVVKVVQIVEDDKIVQRSPLSGEDTTVEPATRTAGESKEGAEAGRKRDVLNFLIFSQKTDRPQRAGSILLRPFDRLRDSIFVETTVHKTEDRWSRELGARNRTASYRLNPADSVPSGFYGTKGFPQFTLLMSFQHLS